MNEQYIVDRAEKKAKQLGYAEYHISPLEFTLSVGESRSFQSDNEHFFIGDFPFGCSIGSDTGVYNKEKPSAKDHITDHNGNVIVKNHTNQEVSVKLIHLVLIK